MNLFNRRKKNKRTIEEQTKANQEYWKKNDVVKDDYQNLMKEIRQSIKEKKFQSLYNKYFPLNE